MEFAAKVSSRACPGGIKAPLAERASVKETAEFPDMKARGGINSREG
jgi:hypothetical protein